MACLSRLVGKVCLAHVYKIHIHLIEYLCSATSSWFSPMISETGPSLRLSGKNVRFWSE